jgi:Uma2 family endonuclease
VASGQGAHPRPLDHRLLPEPKTSEADGGESATWRPRPGGIVPPVATAPTLHRLSPELYDRMVATGLLADEPVELVDGLLVHVTPQGLEHHVLLRRLLQTFAARPDLLHVQMPLAVPGGRPEPDLALAAQDATLDGHPPSAELVVEVAVTSWRDDLAKLPGYAAAGVGTVWLVHVSSRAVHVFEAPYGRRYERERVLRAGDTLHAPAEGIPPLAVSDLFIGFPG